MDFDWPLKETWDGYLMPKRLRARECGTCDGSGYSPEAERLQSRWYSSGEPFDPRETGSEPLTIDTPEVREFAERNVGHAPEFYGKGEAAIQREAQRLADLWNSSWCHHLEQVDVDVLIEAGRLRDFTHTWSKEARWQPIDPTPTVTAAEVNRWSLRGMGHDSSNCWIVMKAKCEREGWPLTCSECDGNGDIARWTGQREEAEAWEPIEPPAGDGWQMWETTSEGSPTSPVFATPEELAEWCATGTTVFGNSQADAAEWLRIITGEDFAHVTVAPGVICI
jgi:hypothetical protein